MCEEIELYETGDEKHYRFRPYVGNTLRFQVKAAHDCHIAFTTEEGETDPMFEVFIGAWEGASSAVRFNKGDDLVKVDTEEILNAEEFREFWIATDHDEVRVGKGEEHEPFMSCTLPEPLASTHFGFSTGWGATGSFRFLCERCLCTEDKLEYQFEPMYGDSVTFNVACAHDAHLAFTTGPEETDPMYEVFIGGWENQNSAVRRNKDTTVVKVDTPDECNGEPKTYWITIREGLVKVGRAGEDQFMEWQDPEPFKVTHAGFCTGWGATGEWKFDV